MMKIKRTFYTSILLLLLAVHAVHAFNWTEVRTLDGEFTTLDQHFEKGKWTLIMLWASDCGVCARQYPVISEFYDKHKDVDAKVIGVSLDGYAELEKITRHISDMPMTFNSLIGEPNVVAFNYEIATEEFLRGTPTYIMFDPQGQLVGHSSGPVEIGTLEKFMQHH